MRFSKTFTITVLILAVIILITAVIGLDTCWEWTKVVYDHVDTKVISTINHYRGYKRGEKDAMEEIANKRVMYSIHGYRINPGRLDVSTGFLERPVAGGLISPFELGYAEGHNRFIKDYFSKNPLPSYSFNFRGDELKEPKKYFTQSEMESVPMELTIETPPAESPDGKYTLYAGKVKSIFNTIDLTKAYLYISTESIVYRSFPGIDECERFHIKWGPPGHDIVFVKWQEIRNKRPADVFYGSLDLRTGQWLVVEEENIQ